MEAVVTIGSDQYAVNFDHPYDISIPLTPNEIGVNCFYAPAPEAEPVRSGSFIGSVRQGGSLNFMNLKVNPHGNGTHTECVGHISSGDYFIRDCLQVHTLATWLMSIHPKHLDNGDRVIDADVLRLLFSDRDTTHIKALIVRTLPNTQDKCYRNYSGTNPVYFTKAAMEVIVERGVEHLLIDLPSVDREEDEGKLSAHKIFWQYPDNIRKNCTITELVYIDDAVKDGLYLLQFQIAPLMLDASPSRPVIYNLEIVQ